MSQEVNSRNVKHLKRSLLACLSVLIIGSMMASGASTAESTANPKLPCQEPSGARVDTSDRLRMLRQRISFFDYGAYIITTDDEHQSEYPSEYDKRRQYITGFTGSVGTAAVLREKGAALWVDGRYHLQAEKELDCNWSLMKMVDPNTPKLIPWIIQSLQNSHSKWVGADPRLIPQNLWLQWEKELTAAGLKLIGNDSNLIDDIWTSTTGRPPEPMKKITVREIKYAGMSWEEKVKLVRDYLANKKLDAVVLTDLDEIAWLLNLRGSDVHYVPVFKSFVFLSQNQIKLYVKRQKLTPETEKHLTSSKKVEILEYESIYSDLKQKSKTAGLRILLPDTASFAIYSLLPKDLVVLDRTPTRIFLVVKNEIEVEGMKKAMLRDSVVLVDFFSMLEIEILEGRKWDEITAAKTVDQFRKKAELSRGPSFESMSAFGPNSASPHYSPSPATNITIDKSSTYLLDSGGQYLDGTTDVTRTVHYGQPTPFQKEAYTRVLQGHISLATLIFPKGTKDGYVELPARRYLYKSGLDYAHGTGHGVGSYLNVHEYPPLIGAAKGYPMLPGMFFSIEPGYYEDGQFGIRLETIFTVVESQTEHHFRNQTFLKFQPVVFVPFEPKLILIDLLTEEQINWLNDYNARTMNTVGVELNRQKNQRALNWLRARTEYIKKNSGTSLRVSAALVIILLIANY